MSVRSGLRLFLVCSAVLSLAQIVSAQAKIAVINTQKAVLESAEIKKASTELENKYKPRQQQMAQLEADIQKLQQQLQAGAGKLTPQAEADLTTQGQRKQKELQRIGQDLQEDVDKERNEILTRSSQKMQDVVRKLAEEKGYDVVVDVSNTIYFKPALDITAEALAAYDKAYPAK